MDYGEDDDDDDEYFDEENECNSTFTVGDTEKAKEKLKVYFI